MFPKVIGIVPVRLGSSRLTKKHLLEVSGRPLLHWLLLRQKHWIQQRNAQLEIVVATTTEAENDILHSVCGEIGVRVFQGNVHNIPKRFLETTEKFEADAALIIDGDDVAVSADAVLSVHHFLTSGWNFVTTAGLPFGMNVSGYSTSLLRNCLSDNEAKVLETGWGRVFSKHQPVRIQFPEHHLHQMLRLSLDYPEDFKFFESLIGHNSDFFIKASDRNILDYIEQHKLYLLNKSVHEKYWENFNRDLEAETKGQKNA
jgi:spore coat polysaccharide biosynthesis protein SpsF (cytidylyltransferase family)